MARRPTLQEIRHLQAEIERLTRQCEICEQKIIECNEHLKLIEDQLNQRTAEVERQRSIIRKLIKIIDPPDEDTHSKSA